MQVSKVNFYTPSTVNKSYATNRIQNSPSFGEIEVCGDEFFHYTSINNRKSTQINKKYNSIAETYKQLPKEGKKVFKEFEEILKQGKKNDYDAYTVINEGKEEEVVFEHIDNETNRPDKFSLVDAESRYITASYAVSKGGNNPLGQVTITKYNDDCTEEFIYDNKKLKFYTKKDKDTETEQTFALDKKGFHYIESTMLDSGEPDMNYGFSVHGKSKYYTECNNGEFVKYYLHDPKKSVWTCVK